MSTDNPWTTLGSREVYKNPWIRVREDRVIRPDGAEGIYGVVETRIATGVVALTPDHHIYLVGQYRYTMEQYSWELPEGGTDDGEDALAAAQRELREETGLVARLWEPLGGEIHLSNCHSSERAWLFLARDLEIGQAAPDGTEVLALRCLPLRDALAMVEDGEIWDAMSILGIYRACHRLGIGPGAGARDQD